MSRPRIFFLLISTAALAVAFAACGGSDSSSSDVPPMTVLNQTFSGDHTVSSGNLDASLKIDVSGEKSGGFDIGVSGPFDGNGSGDPKFDIKAKIKGDVSGQSFDVDGSATATGNAAYIGYQDQEYALSSQQYASLSKVFNQASNQNQNKTQGNLPGLKDSLTDLSNDGETDVDGTNTIHVSGKIDPAKFGDAIKSAIAENSGSGANQAQLQQLQAAIPQLDKVSSSIKDASFDIYSGVDDHILRKLDFNLDIAPPGSSEVNLTFDLTLADVNQPQTITAPSSSQPLDTLLKQLAPLLGGLAPQVAAPPSTGGSSAAGGANSAVLQCLQNATTAAEVQACAAQ